MIRWTMSSVVRLFPLSMVLNIPLSFGSWGGGHTHTDRRASSRH